MGVYTDLGFRKPKCYSTKEFSVTSLICKRCKAYKECRLDYKYKYRIKQRFFIGSFNKKKK